MSFTYILAIEKNSESMKFSRFQMLDNRAPGDLKSNNAHKSTFAPIRMPLTNFLFNQNEFRWNMFFSSVVQNFSIFRFLNHSRPLSLFICV